MPLMKPEIQNVLRAAGLVGEPKNASSDTRTLTEKLDAAGLSVEETLEELATIAKGTMNDGLRVRCLETVLKAHGALKESAPTVPSFTIIINDSSLGSSSVNSTPSPYLEKPAGVPSSINPVLLPRQLLKELNSIN